MATRGRSRPATGWCCSTPAMHEPGSLAQPRTGAGDVRAAPRGRAPGGVHARALRPLRPGGHDRRARGLRAVDAPQPRRTCSSGRGTPTRRSRGAWRSPARAACPRSRCAATRPSARERESGIAAVIEPDRALRAGRHRRHRPRPVDGARDARPRPLARLPVPARAAPADLRRPPAGADLAVLRLRLLARPGGRIPELARRRGAARRAPVPARPRAHVRRRARPHRGQPRARARAHRARAARRSPGARAPPSKSCRRCCTRCPSRPNTRRGC